MNASILLIALSLGQTSDVRTITNYDWFRDYDERQFDRDEKRIFDSVVYQVLTFNKGSATGIEGDVWELTYIYEKLGGNNVRLHTAFTSKGRYKIDERSNQLYVGFYETYMFNKDTRGGWKDLRKGEYEGAVLEYSVRKKFGTKDKFEITFAPKTIVDADNHGNPKGLDDNFAVSSVLKLTNLEFGSSFDVDQEYVFNSHNDFPIPKHIKSPIGRYYKYRPHFSTKSK